MKALIGQVKLSPSFRNTALSIPRGKKVVLTFGPIPASQ
jgi:hypothetical protein